MIEQKKVLFGLVAYTADYAPGRGQCVTDGWYNDKATAEEVYKIWLERYPAPFWFVGLVEVHQARYFENNETWSKK
jgi:hypothetical protein